MMFALLFALSIHTPQTPQVSDRDKQQAVEHYRAGQDALRSEKYDAAEREFQMSIKFDPTNELPRYGLGQTYMAMKRYPDAITAFVNCRDVIHANNVSDAMDDTRRQRRIDDQLQELENQKALYQSPGHSATPSSAGTLQAYMQQLNEQIGALKEARHRKVTTGDAPTPAWLSLALGSAYFRANASADAEREYKAAIAVNPKLGEAHNNLAVVYLTTGRAAEASAELDAAEKAGFKVNPQLKEDIRAAVKKT
jgi:tetratricopeptide (TPR) repeat protein